MCVSIRTLYRPLLLFLGLLHSPSAAAQVASDSGDESRLSTRAWCTDATTLCWNHRTAFSGLRMIFEPQLGVLIQGGDNKFEETNFKTLDKFGVEMNLIQGYLGFQATFIYPTTVTFDDQSRARTNNEIMDSEGRVDVEWGWTFGLTLLDGIIAVGGGELSYDRRDFVDAADLKSFTFDDGFAYINIQPIAALKAALKELQPEPQSGGSG